MSAAAAGGALGLGRAIAVFAAFAFAYFFSTLLRAVTATLAPLFAVELGLGSGDLGLLAGAYFLGFAAMQLPLGSALDRWGPRRVAVAFLTVAVAGCLAFAAARSLTQLLLARLLIGVGVAACLMAPLTCYRHRFAPAVQVRANAWMLMTGSLGMLASTLPVQWLLPHTGWRGLFAGVALALLGALLLVWRLVPADVPGPAAAAGGGYRAVFAHPAFRRLAPLGVLGYGSLVALQTLWIGPWLSQVGGQDAAAAARGLFVVNLAMLLAFLGWGLVVPRLQRAGWDGERLIAVGWPLGAALGALALWQGPQASAALWAAWCVAASVVSLAQPAVAQAFPLALAGRALSAYNLLIFAGVFVLQWGIGLAIDALQARGWPTLQAFRAAFGACLGAAALAALWLNLARRRVAAAGR